MNKIRKRLNKNRKRRKRKRDIEWFKTHTFPWFVGVSSNRVHCTYIRDQLIRIIGLHNCNRFLKDEITIQKIIRWENVVAIKEVKLALLWVYMCKPFKG